MGQNVIGNAHLNVRMVLVTDTQVNVVGVMLDIMIRSVNNNVQIIATIKHASFQLGYARDAKMGYTETTVPWYVLVTVNLISVTKKQENVSVNLESMDQPVNSSVHRPVVATRHVIRGQLDAHLDVWLDTLSSSVIRFVLVNAKMTSVTESLESVMERAL